LRTEAAYYFDADITNELSLSGSVGIRRVKKQEKYSYGKLTDKNHGYGWGNEGPISFVFECVASNGEEARSTLRKLATTLLVFKRDLIANDQLPWFRVSFGGSRGSESPNRPLLKSEELDDEKMDRHSRYYSLSITDIDDFKKFWAKCSQTTWHPTLLVTGGRLVMSQHRVGAAAFEDKLIDVMIGCEALVLSGSDRDKGDPIAERLGKLQSGKAFSDDYARRSLRVAYKLRNDVVHQGILSNSQLLDLPTARFPDFVVHVERMLRGGIDSYIDLMNQGKSKMDIIEYLDSLP
jgi:hypothetical protein